MGVERARVGGGVRGGERELFFVGERFVNRPTSGERLLRHRTVSES
jgi:hypothetical protein